MNEKQAKFLELAKYSEQLKEKQSEVYSELNALMLELGLNTMFQDPDTLVVYKVIKPTGTFTYYKDLDYARTSMEGERSGSLSKKQAEEAGFVLKK